MVLLVLGIVYLVATLAHTRQPSSTTGGRRARRSTEP